MSNERSLDARPCFPFSCLPHLLEHQARRIPDAPAILAPGRVPLTYRRLYQHIAKMGRTLQAAGIGGRDRVAVVLPNGPEMPVAVLAVTRMRGVRPGEPSLWGRGTGEILCRPAASCVDYASWNLTLRRVVWRSLAASGS